MPSVINRVPPGLLSVLDIKAQGQNPRFLGDQVTPVLDFWELYVAEKTVPKASAIVGSGTIGLKVTIQVPNNEFWWVLQMDSSMSSIAAGEIATIYPYYFGRVLGGAYYEGAVGPGVTNQDAAGQVVHAPADRQFWAYPGELLGTYHGRMTGAAVDLQTRLLVVPFPL